MISETVYVYFIKEIDSKKCLSFQNRHDHAKRIASEETSSESLCGEFMKGDPVQNSTIRFAFFSQRQIVIDKDFGKTWKLMTYF